MHSKVVPTQPLPTASAIPGPEEALAELARSLLSAGDDEGAIEAYQQAVALAPERTDLLAELGNAWQDLNNPQEALVCYRRAVEVDPGNISARQNLGYLLGNLGEPEQAIEHFEQLLKLWPSPISQVLAATVLPVIYDKPDEISAWRNRFASRVQSLVESGLCVDTTRSQIPTNFLLAYQGSNDRELARNLGRIYQGPSISPTTTRREGAHPGRLRIGLLSAFFRDHTIGRLFLGLVQQLSREQLELFVLSASSSHDQWSCTFREAAEHFVSIPRNVEQARNTIAELDLDVLIFVDVGMDAITSTLAFSRMAPIQCATWGHPDTTGSRTMDYFVSSKLLDTEVADEHYTERLIRLPLIGCYYHRPRLVGPPQPRSSFGLGEEKHLYTCPQTLYKFHPDFDAVLAGILQTDPLAEIVLLEGRVTSWTDRLRRRFAHTLPDADRRVRFLPAQNHQEYLSLLSLSDVILDPLHFGGGNSSYEALAMGSPIVTLPSAFFRGRLTAGLYAKMNFRDLVVDSPERYIRTAVRLATHPEFARAIRQQITETSSTLFEDPREIQGWEEFLLSLRTQGTIEEECANV